jgi:DNA topoisomerase II
MIELAFAKARVNDRKRWLTDHVPGSYFDHARDDLTFSNFINKELILFSIADNARSIPSVVDGLKPSQRKVLFACFKRKLVKNEIKVAQLAGYVSEHAAYHHGEASLQATILGLAQNFVGSNNANLLVPAGQFGTRLQGGKDAASSRYIFTKLAPIARALFPEPDDHVLRYLEDDGLSIEPEWYCPVIPTVLLNGADGIGTGWSSQVPCYNPRDLIANIRRMIAGDEPQELIPWYRGFLGTVTPVGNSKSYDVHGTVTGGGADDVFVVRELPVRTWTTPYKDFLEAHVVGNPEGGKQTPFIKECADQGTENKVCFTVTLTADAAAGAADGGIYKKLKLSSSVTTSNMMLFDAEGRIAKYGDTSSIFNEFFGVRMATYERRRAFLLGALEDELECLDNKQRFILMVVDGKLLVSKRKKAVIVADLVKHGFKRIPKAAKRAGGVKAGGGRLAGHAQRIGDENGASSSSEAEGGTRGDGALAGGATDFDYLLSLPIYSLTMERVERLCAQRDEKAAERDEMEATTAADMWRRDLDHLETVLAEGEAQAAKDAVELEKAARAAQRKQGGARGGGRGHSKKVLHAGLEDEGDEGGGAGPIPPPSARTEKVRQARAPKETAAKAVKPASTKASAGAAGATAARKASKARRGGEGIELEEYDSDTSSSQDEEAGYVSDGDSDAEDGELVDSAPERSDDGGVVRMPPARPGARGAVAAAKLCAAPASKAKSVAACPARPRSKKPVVYVSDDSSGAEGDNGAPAAGDSAGAPESGDDDADVFMPPAKPTTKGADASKPRVPPAAKAKPVAARPAGSRLRKKPAPPVVVASESERDGSGSSSEDDAQNMTLAERLAQRGRAAVQGAPSSREGTGGAGSGKPQVLTSSLIPAFTSPAAASKRQRAGARPAEAIAAAVPDEMFSPSPRQVKKKSRVVSPAAAKPKAKSLVAKPAAAAKPKPRARVKARVPAKTSKKQLVIDTPSERGAGEEDSADAETPKAPAARPRRGTVKKSIVIDSSSGDEVGTADDDDEFDADDDDDSDFE